MRELQLYNQSGDRSDQKSTKKQKSGVRLQIASLHVGFIFVISFLPVLDTQLVTFYCLKYHSVWETAE